MKNLLLLAFVLLVSTVQAQWTKADFEKIFKEYDYKKSPYFEEYHFAICHPDQLVFLLEQYVHHPDE